MFAGRQLHALGNEAVEHMAKYGYQRTTEQINARYNNCQRRRWPVSLDKTENNASNIPDLQSALKNDDVKMFKADNRDIEFDSALEDATDTSKSCGGSVFTAVSKSDCTCQNMDSVDYYCMSMAKDIKKFDNRKQAKLKIEMMQLMYRAEYDPNF